MQLVFTIFPKVIDVQTNVRYNQVISKKTEVSIHVTICVGILFLKKDGIDSSPEIPKLIREQFFVISYDTQHDRSFTQHCQKQIFDYLKSISSNVTCMHEWTDGCSSQYESRLCMGDVSYNTLG